jgi:hypothetical protein
MLSDVSETCSPKTLKPRKTLKNPEKPSFPKKKIRFPKKNQKTK